MPLAYTNSPVLESFSELGNIDTTKKCNSFSNQQNTQHEIYKMIITTQNKFLNQHQNSKDPDYYKSITVQLSDHSIAYSQVTHKFQHLAKNTQFQTLSSNNPNNKIQAAFSGFKEANFQTSQLHE